MINPFKNLQYASCALALVSATASTSCTTHRDHILDLISEEVWQCDDEKQFRATQHFGLGTVVLHAAGRDYSLTVLKAKSVGERRAKGEGVRFSARYHEGQSHAEVRGATGGPYRNCSIIR